MPENPLSDSRTADMEPPSEKRRNSKDQQDTDSSINEDEQIPSGGNIYDQDGGKNYRTMNRKDTILVLTTTQFGLATVSLPSILLALGIIPGLVAIIGFGLLTWYGGFQLFQFYKKHSQVVNIVEAARIVGGKPFAIVTGILVLVQLMFTCSSAIVTMSIALNTISRHAICTVGFMAVAGIFFYIICLPRTMKFVSMSGGPNAFGVVAGILVAIIGLAISKPQSAPEGWTREIQVIGTPSFRDASNACLKALWAYCSNVGFLSYMAEMKDPVRDFKFCLAVLEVSSIVLYSTMAVVIYCLAGQFTDSPAIGSAPLLFSQIAYGFLMLAIIATALSSGHVPTKLVYVAIMRKMGALKQMTDSSFKSWGTWVACVTTFWIIAFIVANVIPAFDLILQISAATTVPWLTLGHSAIFWLYINRAYLTPSKLAGNWKKACLAAACVFMITVSVLVNGLGLWSSITALLDFFSDPSNDIQGVFSCGDNS